MLRRDVQETEDSFPPNVPFCCGVAMFVIEARSRVTAAQQAGGAGQLRSMQACQSDHTWAMTHGSRSTSTRGSTALRSTKQTETATH